MGARPPASGPFPSAWSDLQGFLRPVAFPGEPSEEEAKAMAPQALTPAPLLSSSVQRHGGRLPRAVASVPGTQSPTRHCAPSQKSASGAIHLVKSQSGAHSASAKPAKSHQSALQGGLGYTWEARFPDVAAAAAGDAAPGGEELVLVVGATGGVGQLVVASLLEKGKKVRALVRNVAKAKEVFSGAPDGALEIVTADLRFPDKLKPELMKDVGWVVLATGTTAFPSKRWDDNNGPEQTDYVSTKNFLEFCPKTVQRILLVSSIGVTRYNQLPFNILNLFGVLKYKRMAEELLQTSGIPYTILRPGRLTDGPYTSYDLNTLLKATSGLRKAVVINKGDSISGETSRIAVAEAVVQALFSDSAKNEVFEVGSVEGSWPGSELGKWDDLFAKAPTV